MEVTLDKFGTLVLRSRRPEPDLVEEEGLLVFTGEAASDLEGVVAGREDAGLHPTDLQDDPETMAACVMAGNARCARAGTQDHESNARPEQRLEKRREHALKGWGLSHESPASRDRARSWLEAHSFGWPEVDRL